MKVLYDYQAFLLQTHGGVTRCFAEIARHLPADCTSEFAVVESDNIYLTEYGLAPEVKPLHMSRATFLGGVDAKWKEIAFNALNYVPGAGTPKTLNRKHAIARLKSGDFDVFHPTFFDNYFLPYLNGRPYVLTIHDMISDVMPKDRNRSDRQIADRNRLVDGASHIVVVSENTKRDVSRLLGVPDDKMTVVYHGGPDVDLDSVRREKPLVEGDYLLFVGSRSVAYKNFVPFVQQCASVLRDHPGLRIMCTGSAFSQEELDLFDSLGIGDRMMQRFASTSELFNLYHNALGFVFPSAYEGFGLPVLEAFACGCPVLLNDASCFPEIAGDAALFFRLDELGEVVRSFVDAPAALRAEMAARGFDRLHDFSWESAGQKMADIYRKCATAPCRRGR